LAFFLNQILDTLSIGSVYLLVAIGISLVYGLARYVNFAQGELVTLGAFISYELVRRGLPIGLAIACSAVIVAASSELLEFFLFRRTILRPFNGFVISLGIITGLEGIYATIYPDTDYELNPVIRTVSDVGGVFISWNGALFVVVTVVTTLLVMGCLRWTRTGRFARAIAEDRTASMVLGIPVVGVTAVVFMAGSGLAGLAGGLLATAVPFSAYSGSDFLLEGFAVAIVGGLGNIKGAAIAVAVLAFADTFGSGYISLAWGPDFGLAALIVMLLIFPTGILRGTETGEALGAADSAVALSGAAGLQRLSAWGVSRDWWRSLARPNSASPPGVAGRGRLATGKTLAGSPLVGWGRRSSGLTWIVAGAVIVVIPLFDSSGQFVSDCTYSGILAIAAYGAWFLFRYAGIPSIAQAAFMGVGAYVSALVAEHLAAGFWAQMGLAFCGGTLAAALIGMICLRTRGSYFLIIVFAFVGIVVDVLTNWASVTGGPDGIIITTAARPLGGLVSFTSPDAYYWLVVACLGAVMIGMRGLDRSRFGQRLIAVRDNELLAESLGLAAYRYKVAAFALCGGVSALAGTLYLYQQLAIEPSLFGIFPGVTILLAVLLGGVGVLPGPVIGTAVLTLLPTMLGFSPETVQILDGAVLVLVILFLPLGIGGSLKQGYRWTLLHVSERGRVSAVEGAATSASMVRK
jgi:branched-subunit amino acid ABC-type transport system permease component